MSKIFQYRLLLALAAVVFFLDQTTKLWIDATLPYGTFFNPDCIQVIPGFFHIVYVGNTGAAWSMFSEYTWALNVIGVIALGLIFFGRKALELKLPRIQLAFGLIIGGIVGNLIDRIRLGYVVDFLDFNFWGYHYPSFNIADSGITVGAVLFACYSLFPSKNQDS